jgi:hypothetical protein
LKLANVHDCSVTLIPFLLLEACKRTWLFCDTDSFFITWSLQTYMTVLWHWFICVRYSVITSWCKSLILLYFTVWKVNCYWLYIIYFIW